MFQVTKEQGFLHDREGLMPEISLENEEYATQVTGAGELGHLHLGAKRSSGRVKHQLRQGCAGNVQWRG